MEEKVDASKVGNVTVSVSVYKLWVSGGIYIIYIDIDWCYVKSSLHNCNIEVESVQKI